MASDLRLPAQFGTFSAQSWADAQPEFTVEGIHSTTAPFDFLPLKTEILIGQGN